MKILITGGCGFVGRHLVNVLNRATENKGVTVRDGFDVNKNKIDDNSNVRFGAVESRPKCAQQLFTRPYATVPFMGRGMVDNAEENEIKTISNFLPSQLSKEEIDEVINKTIKASEFNSMRDMGKVIKIIKEQYDGMMDFGYVSKVVKEKLSNL